MVAFITQKLVTRYGERRKKKGRPVGGSKIYGTSSVL